MVVAVVEESYLIIAAILIILLLQLPSVSHVICHVCSSPVDYRIYALVQFQLDGHGAVVTSKICRSVPWPLICLEVSGFFLQFEANTGRVTLCLPELRQRF